MSEHDIACQYFEHVAEYSVAACRECRYAVWPDQIESHLQKQHKVSRKQADIVGEQIRSWAGLLQYPSELEVPGGVPKPVPQLAVYTNGLLCQLDLGQCLRIFRSSKTIKKHWRVDHGWSASSRHGRLSQIRQKSVQVQIEKAYQLVHCQRLFGSRHGSQYFEVQPPSQNQERPSTVPTDGSAAWARVGEQMAKAWENVEKRANKTIQEGEMDEVNPWVERTQWLPYLVGMERADLMACIEEPVAKQDPRSDNEAEPVESAIWAAMAGLTRFSQASVIKRVGVFVRLEAIRTEKHQTRFQPLQPYMDQEAIVKHTRPWQQVLMFFARTQKEHAWKSPGYKFMRRQQEAWEALIWEAEAAAARGAEEEIDEIDEEAEAGEEQGRAEGNQAVRLPSIQKACLKFCIALLDYRITRREYDSPLVCALAVLSQGARSTQP
jgi:hypothetical protein